MLAFISIFMTSFLGVYIIYKFKDLRNFGIVIMYGALTTISNLLTIVLSRFMYNIEDGLENKINYDISFFGRYTVFNIVIAFVISVLYVLITKAVKVSITNEKIKKSKKNNKKNIKNTK